MQYAMLIYMDEQRWDALPEAERQQIKTETDAYAKRYGESGQILTGIVLRGAWTATTLRKQRGKLLTDGPFTETKEVIAGVQLMECKDLEEAVAIGGEFPGLNAGLRCEVRPVGDNCGDLRGPVGSADTKR
jgi:hypothetical protein